MCTLIGSTRRPLWQDMRNPWIAQHHVENSRYELVYSNTNNRVPQSQKCMHRHPASLSNSTFRGYRKRSFNEKRPKKEATVYATNHACYPMQRSCQLITSSSPSKPNLKIQINLRDLPENQGCVFLTSPYLLENAAAASLVFMRLKPPVGETDVLPISAISISPPTALSRR